MKSSQRQSSTRSDSSVTPHGHLLFLLSFSLVAFYYHDCTLGMSNPGSFLLKKSERRRTFSTLSFSSLRCTDEEDNSPHCLTFPFIFIAMRERERMETFDPVKSSRYCHKCATTNSIISADENAKRREKRHV